MYMNGEGTEVGGRKTEDGRGEFEPLMDTNEHEFWETLLTGEMTVIPTSFAVRDSCHGCPMRDEMAARAEKEG